MSDTPRIDKLLIILGSMKSGTTTLFNLLDAHPSICGSREKEPMFFARPEVHDLGYDWYLDLWSGIQPGQIALEGSTDYTKYPFVLDVPEKLKAFLDANDMEPHFVFLMRDPISRIEAHLKHLFFVGADTIDLPQDYADPDVGIPDRALAYSSYALQLDQFKASFPSAKIQLFNMLDLIADPLSMVNEIVSALDIQTLEEEDLPKKRKFNDASSIEEWGHLPGLYSIVTENWFFKKVINPAFTPERKRKLRLLISSPPKQYRHMLHDAEKHALARLLEPDLLRLKRDYGFDYLKAWPTLQPYLQKDL